MSEERSRRSYAGSSLIPRQGRRTSLTRGNGTSTSYAYDPASRLISLANAFPADAGKNLTLGFFHNPAGQIVGNTRSNDQYASTIHGSGSLSYGTDGLNRMTSWGSTPVSYDPKGNMTNDGRDRAFTFSSENLLTKYTRPSNGGVGVFGYDPLLRFTDSNPGTPLLRTFQYDGHDLIAEYDASGQLITCYVHVPGGGDEPLALIFPTGERHWFSADERGSVINVTRQDGTTRTLNIYDEYGRPGWNGFRFQYTGAPILTFDLLYLRNRVYDAERGRFLQTDPIGYGDGMNLYAYVGGDPVNKIDPSGTFALRVKKIEPRPPHDNGQTITVTGPRVRMPQVATIRVVGTGGLGRTGTTERGIGRAAPQARSGHRYRTNNKVCSKPLGPQQRADVLSIGAIPGHGESVTQNGIYLAAPYGIPGGYVQTRFSADRNQVVNVTTWAHAFSGSVTRTIYSNSGGTFIETIGVGNAGGALGNVRDFVNQVAGPQIFGDIDHSLADYSRKNIPGC